MATPHHPRRGSKGYYPRVRAQHLQSDIRSWPEIEGKPKIQAFAGYKVGMTHVEMVDYRKNSVTSGQSIMSAVTIIEVPPLSVVGIRYYDRDENGLYVVEEQWAENLDKDIYRRIPERKKKPVTPTVNEVIDVRLVVSTSPSDVTGVPSKTPEIFEIRIGGSDLKEKIAYANERLNKKISFDEFSSPGKFVDAISITKGKGFTGHVERFGVKLLPYKNRKHRRMIGTLGPWHPDWVRNTVPQAGQMGAHQRTASNIRVLKFSKKDSNDDINVKGGFPGYGVVRGDYILVHGSIPGPAKRLVKMRDPSRQKTPDMENLTISYISKESKQGD